jgi:glycerol-3-phosphate acyltransferase PlsY
VTVNPWIALIAAVAGYLLGSLSFARIVSRFVAPDVDIGQGSDFVVEATGETVHSDSIAGTTVATELGDKYGCLVGIGDILKAAAPALVLKLMYPDPSTPYYLVAAFTAVVGHNWPLYHRFKGGTGLSPSTGGFLVMDWLGTIISSLIALVLGLLVIRGPFGIYFAYSGMILAMIPWVWFRWHHPYKLIYVVAVVIIYLIGSIPGLKYMAERKKSGAPDIDTATILQMMPMGRGMQKMKGWFRRGKGDTEEAEQPSDD